MSKELLFSITKKDFIIEPYKGSGKGGQHRNKTMSCIRMKHPDSGAMAQACEDRDQRKNRKTAFLRLIDTEEFKTWLKMKQSEHSFNADELEKAIRKRVDDWMAPEYLDVTYGEEACE